MASVLGSGGARWAPCQGDPDFVQNGRVTDKGLEELRARMPFADLSGFEKNPEVSKLSDLFTVI
jgi:hypothetical protein